MRILPVLFLLFTLAAAAADKPYNETADAKADIKRALAKDKNTPLLVVFGANWCGDCRALEAAMKHGTGAALLARDFRIVKVDVGHFDKNVDIAKSYGVPLDKGIPTIAVVSPQNNVLYVTREGELADARKMGDDGIYKFLKSVTADSKGRN